MPNELATGGRAPRFAEAPDLAQSERGLPLTRSPRHPGVSRHVDAQRFSSGTSERSVGPT